MKHCPLIGLSTRAEDENGRYAVSSRYVACVIRAGANVVLLPPDGFELTALLDRIDGLILSGGGDISPPLYGGLSHEKIYGVDIKRDNNEIAFVQYAVESGLPILGICRGIQVMNVAFGGTLIEDIPDSVGESVQHRLPGKEECFHSVRVSADSQLANIFGQTEMEVPSFHHQAVKKTAERFREAAHSADGVVEAVEIPDYPFAIGVQWHPELSVDPLQQKLFDAFVERASKKMQGRKIFRPCI